MKIARDASIVILTGAGISAESGVRTFRDAGGLWEGHRVEEVATPDKETLKREFLDSLFYMQGKFPALATRRDYYMALAYMVRDQLLHRWVSTAEAYTRLQSRTVAYLSAEFLMGPHLV